MPFFKKIIVAFCINKFGFCVVYRFSFTCFSFQSDCSATGLGPGMSSPHGPPPLILKSTSPMTHGSNATSSSFVMSNPLYNPPSKDATSSSHHWAPYSNFLDIPEQIFAQQLTKMDCVRFLIFFDGFVFIKFNCRYTE